MLESEELDKYYQLKEQRDKLSSELNRLKIKIVSKMQDENILTDIAGNYYAEIEYQTSTTPELINFVKEHKHYSLISETVSKKNYDKLKKKYHFTPEQEKFLINKKLMPKLKVNMLKKPVQNNEGGI